MYRIELTHLNGDSEPSNTFGRADSFHLYTKIEAQLSQHHLIHIDAAGVALEDGAHLALCGLVMVFGPEMLGRIILTDTSDCARSEIQELRHDMCQYADWLAYWAGEFKDIPCPNTKESPLCIQNTDCATSK